jgi:hypothetical protein
MNTKADVRAKRFPIKAPVHYREADSPHWHKGRTQNLSCSGALIAGRHRLAPSAPIEVLLPLPNQISGKASVQVLCSGKVVRVNEAKVPVLRSSFGVQLQEVRMLEVETPVSRYGMRSGDWRPLVHEMYNELAVVVGNSELLLDNGQLMNRQRITIIKRSSARVVALLQRLSEILRKHTMDVN